MRPSPNAFDRSAKGSENEGNAISIDSARSQMTRIIYDRRSSETAVVGLWRYVPLAAVSFAALAGIAFFILVPNVNGFVFGYLAIYSVSFAILAIINYKLVRSMNEHFRREAVLRPLLIGIVRHRSMRSPTPKAKEAISEMERVNREASVREQPKSEMIAAMAALPIVGIVFGFAFLRSHTVARTEHDRKWNEFLRQLQVAESMSVDDAVVGGDRKSTGANFWFFFAASLLFFPFLAYWYHVIERACDRHLQEQWRSEDQLARSLL